MKNIKITFLCFLICMVSCKDENIEIPQPIDVFKIEKSTVSNKTEISFNVEKEGMYIVTMIDKNTNQVISREKIKCITGNNKIKIYTKTLPSRYLYLKLEDSFNNQLANTIIIVK